MRIIVIIVAHAAAATAAARGPRGGALGWSSWYAFGSGVDQLAMQQTYAKLANRSVAPVGPSGARKSLVDVGFTLANLDDGYQACGAGVNGSFHDARGFPIFDPAKFTNVSAMTAAARAVNLTPGFYANNYICSEPTPWGGVGGAAYNTVMRGSVQFLVDNGFGFVKVDSGSCYNDMSLWHDLIADTGADIYIENCHQGGEPPNATWCPYDWWRVGGDVNGEGPDFEILQVIAALPTARAGCLPYPDFMALSPSNVDESRSLFGLYAVMGVPMIMSFDVRDDAQLLPLWDVLTNEEVIAVHSDTTAAAGVLLRKFSPHAAQDPVFAWAEPCNAGDPAQGGWALDGGARHVTWQPAGAATPLCLAGAGLGASLALTTCSSGGGGGDGAQQLWQVSGARLWQASPAPDGSGSGSGSGVGDLALAPCAPKESHPGQQWTFTLGGSVQTNVQSNLSTRMGGCWEITGCDFGERADVGTTYGCKGLPNPGDKSACDYNGAWAFNEGNGTITSVMSGACLEVQDNASGGRVEVSSCSNATNQRWSWGRTGGGPGSVSGQVESVSQPGQCIDKHVSHTERASACRPPLT